MSAPEVKEDDLGGWDVLQLHQSYGLFLIVASYSGCRGACSRSAECSYDGGILVCHRTYAGDRSSRVPVQPRAGAGPDLTTNAPLKASECL
jgi:hypothetical protein